MYLQFNQIKVNFIVSKKPEANERGNVIGKSRKLEIFIKLGIY